MLEYGCVRTKAADSLAMRLKQINAELQAVINKYKPQAASIEQVFFNPQSTAQAMIGQARGAIVLTAALNDINLFEYNPKHIKMALTGYGSADKHQMQHMVKTFLRLKEIPKPDDAADALAIAVCHAHSAALTQAR
jgi:crossover junction endodeoxyribonuclease RuvC